jgi:hypothetical protein
MPAELLSRSQDAQTTAIPQGSKGPHNLYRPCPLQKILKKKKRKRRERRKRRREKKEGATLWP